MLLGIGLLSLGTFYLPISIGVILGYSISYYRQDGQLAWPPDKTTWKWVLGFAGGLSLLALVLGLPAMGESAPTPDPIMIDASAGVMYYPPPPSTTYLGIIYFFFTVVAMGLFFWWRQYFQAAQRELTRHGSARFARRHELRAFRFNPEGNNIYIGGDEFFYSRYGHHLTFCSTRGGKTTALLLPNLLGASSGNSSWLVIDPKGELAAITADYQRSLGKQVYILNPFELLGMMNHTYNPLDLLADHSRKSLADDAQLLATMLVPKNVKQDSHWDKKARSLLAGIMMHLATTAYQPESKHELSLGYIWQVLNSSHEDWLAFLTEMALNEHPITGSVVAGIANSTLSLMATSEKEAASIHSALSGWMDIFKSPQLRESLQSSEVNMNLLSQGNMVVYVNVPAETLATHFTWLRIVITTAMQAVIRNPKEQVVFLLEEFYSLGYLQQIEVALGTYAGYGIKLWCVLQSLVQLQSLYGKNWENFIGNSAVIQAFGVNDQTTAEYFSKMAGTTSIPTYKDQRQRGLPQGSTGRPLLSPDEIRRLDQEMLVFIENNAVARLPKVPYYEHPVWSQRAKPNPYYRG
ncbi:MAG: type IV secretory system conjugative DNA transfer family protein [Bacteroidota bacterium]